VLSLSLTTRLWLVLTICGETWHDATAHASNRYSGGLYHTTAIVGRLELRFAMCYYRAVSMCALVHLFMSQVDRLVYGSADYKAGAHLGRFYNHTKSSTQSTTHGSNDRYPVPMNVRQ